ncbi:unnamed protein product, partial [Urochloa humidicola]
PDLLHFPPSSNSHRGAAGEEAGQGGRRRIHHQQLVLPLFPSTSGGLAAMADTNPDAIKRYTPPVHRNRANNRRKSGGWTAAMNLYNDQTVDSSEKPVMYSGSTGSSWGHLKLPHQMNFLEELRHAVDAHTDIRSPVDSWN